MKDIAKMSLTSGARFEREWGDFPALALFFSNNQPSFIWTGASTASDNIFEQVHRAVKIQALVQDASGFIKNITHHEIPYNPQMIDKLRCELHALANTINGLSEKFSEMARKVNEISSN